MLYQKSASRSALALKKKLEGDFHCHSIPIGQYMMSYTSLLPYNITLLGLTNPEWNPKRLVYPSDGSEALASKTRDP
jgi:hypothetical protein